MAFIFINISLHETDDPVFHSHSNIGYFMYSTLASFSLFGIIEYAEHDWTLYLWQEPSCLCKLQICLNESCFKQSSLSLYLGKPESSSRNINWIEVLEGKYRASYALITRKQWMAEVTPARANREVEPVLRMSLSVVFTKRLVHSRPRYRSPPLSGNAVIGNFW
jgi:hypothetical protein